MKRVLVFSLNYYPFVGGAEVAIQEITNRLPEDEYEFHVLAPHYDSKLPREERMGRVTVHRIGLALPGATISDQSRFPLKCNKYWYQLRAASYAERLHRQHRFDIVWGMMAHAVGIPAGMFKKRHPDVKYVLTLQEGDPPAYIERVMKPVWSLFQQGFTEADVVQAISNFLMAWGRRMGAKGVGVVIPNGVDAQRFMAPISTEEREAVRATFGGSSDDVYLITASRLVHKNAVDDVIRALTHLPEQVRFVVCGIGPDHAKLEALAKELGVRERVQFRGEVSHEKLPKLLAASDIFIRPSRSEGMGNAFIEAMAAGVPVIATQVGGIEDFLFDSVRNEGKGATGWAVDPDAPEQIAKAVENILSHPDLTGETVARARALASVGYDWNLIAKRMHEEVFQSFGTSTEQGTIPGMRLLVATPLYPPESGGPATYAKVLEDGLPSRDISVSLVKFGDVRSQPKLLRHLSYFWLVFKAAKHVDVILGLDPVSVGFPALIAAKLRRKPFVVKVVGDYAWEQGRQRFGIWLPLEEFVRTDHHPLPVYLFQKLETYVARNAVRVIVPSEYLKGIVTAWGVPSERIQVIVNAKPSATPGAFPEALASLPSPRIVTAGRLVPWKGMHGVIAAMIAVRKRIPTAELIIVGDGPEREALERYARIRLQEGYTFTGQLPHGETLGTIQGSDVFVLNSSYEGLSHLLLEALELGKAIIATKAGGNGEVIEHGKNGLLISVGDPEALAEAVVSILNDVKGKAELEAAAKESALRFTPELMLESTATLLSSLV